MNICTQNNTTVEMCLGKQLDLSGKEKKNAPGTPEKA